MKLRVSLDITIDRDGKGGLIVTGTGHTSTLDASGMQSGVGFNQRRPVSLPVFQRAVGDLLLTAVEQAPKAGKEPA